MNEVRVGIVGYGNMGKYHADSITAGKIDGLRLAAVCDVNPDRILLARTCLGGEMACYADPSDLFASGDLDAVIISTPHYLHPPLAMEALSNGLHVLVEKPAGVYTKQVREMNDAFSRQDRVFGIMFNQRTNPIYVKLRDMLIHGELGEIRRTCWIITSWYRTQSYYNSSDWRATWAGEGGGVLLNQDPHQLDLLLWCTGLVPARVRAFCAFGKMHDIEVEDDVTAYIEYTNGATGTFITSTYETPGTNRLEISGDLGKIVIENDRMVFFRNEVSERAFNAAWDKGFGAPAFEEIAVPAEGPNPQHIGILQNFTDAVRSGTPLIAPGEDGIHGLALSNAIHLSTWIDGWADFPVDEDLFYEELQQRCRTSRFTKSVQRVDMDITRST